MRRSFSSAILIAAMFAGSARLLAQQPQTSSATTQSTYVFGGANLSPDTPATYGVIAGVGWPLTPTVSFEFAFAFRTGGDSRNWALFGFSTTNRYERLSRDFPVGFTFRFSSLSNSRVKPAFVLGGGFNVRSDDDYVIAACPLDGVCTSRPHVKDGGESFMEPMFIAGSDVVIPVGGRFEFVPSFRLFTMRRGQCDEGGRACISQPQKPDPFRVEAGVKLAWLLK